MPVGHYNRASANNPIERRLRVLLKEPIPKKECILWPGRVTIGGYGTKRLNKKVVLAHRYICERYHGSPKVGDCAIHKCDNPPCINPNHLSWGTQQENIKDARAKKRFPIPNGEKNPRAKIDNAQAREIRRLFADGDITPKEISNRYGVSRSSIYKIIRWETFTNL